MSIEGLFIANIYEHSEVDKFTSRRKRITNDKERKSISSDNLDSYKKSVVSFDYGGDWHPIRAPKVD